MKSILLLAFAVTASASVMTYDLTITMNTGPLSGQTGSGTISYDPALATSGGGFTWVDPTDGLTVFTITFQSQTLTMSQVVGYNVGPIVLLLPGGIMNNPFGLWGSTDSTLAPDYFINAIEGQPAGFTYDTSTSNHTFSGSGYQLGYGLGSAGPTNQQSTGVVTWTLETTSDAPEPSAFGSLGLILTALAVGLKRRKSA